MDAGDTRSSQYRISALEAEVRYLRQRIASLEEVRQLPPNVVKEIASWLESFVEITA